MRFLTEEQFEQIVHEEKIKFQKFIEQQTRDFYQALYDFLDINNLWIEAEDFFSFDTGVLTSAYVDFDETVNLLKQKVTPFGSCCFQVYGDKKPVINAVAKQSQKSKEIELVDINETTFYFQFDCNYASCVHDIQIVQDQNENKKRIFTPVKI